MVAAMSTVSLLTKETATSRFLHSTIANCDSFAETPENRKDIFQGQKDTVLSEFGLQQAQVVGDRLKDEKFTHIFSSDLTRARQTRDAILENNQHSASAEVAEDRLLRERKYGEMEGSTTAEFKRLATLANTTPKAFVPKGAETLEQVRRRAVKFLLWLCATLPMNKDEHGGNFVGECGKNSETVDGENMENSSDSFHDKNQIANVLVVSHGGLIKQLLLHFSGNLKSNLSVQLKHTAITIPNTGVSIFHVYLDERTKKPSYIDCRLVNDASHLEHGRRLTWSMETLDRSEGSSI